AHGEGSDMSTDSSIDLGDHARERLLAAAAVLPAGERLLVELVVGRGVALAEALRLRGRDVRPAGLVETVSVTTRRGRRRRLLLGPLAASLGRELASAGDGRPPLRTRYGRPPGPLSGAAPQADGGTRTPDPFITSEVLYQLSYVGVLRPPRAESTAEATPRMVATHPPTAERAKTYSAAACWGFSPNSPSRTSGDRTCSIAMTAAPKTPARSWRALRTICRWRVASGVERW
ncbi:MAG: hypothetical protein QOF04_194, partial [Solirubrobacteraceae bacterium]|nr:hypothetical protein [Solirubrobacteraceae bacterium]